MLAQTCESFLRNFFESELDLHPVKIFIQEVRSGKFFAGNDGWSHSPEDAYAFPSSIAALNFCQQMEREQSGKQFIMRFDRPDSLQGLRVFEGLTFAPVSA